MAGNAGTLACNAGSSGVTVEYSLIVPQLCQRPTGRLQARAPAFAANVLDLMHQFTAADLSQPLSFDAVANAKGGIASAVVVAKADHMPAGF